MFRLCRPIITLSCYFSYVYVSFVTVIVFGYSNVKTSLHSESTLFKKSPSSMKLPYGQHRRLSVAISLFHSSFLTHSKYCSSITKSKPKKAIVNEESIKYSLNRELLPDETIYVIDGSSLVFKSYFSEEKNKHYTTAELSKPISEKLINEFFSNSKKEELSNTEVDGVKPSTIINDRNQISCSHLIMMASHFVSLIEFLHPKYLVIVFDAGGKTFRNDLYSDYKQHRKEKPEEIDLMFQLAPRILELLGCKCLKQYDYEADDVMATLGLWCRSKGLNVVHVSDDKDMFQCVSEGIHVMNPRSRQFYNINDVEKKIGLLPSQLTDYYALSGDDADGIPGVAGVGEKTAVALIKYFGTIENMLKLLKLDNLNDSSSLLSDEDGVAELKKALIGVRVSKDKLWSALKNAAENDKLLLYKNLVTLRYDVPITMPEGLGYQLYSELNETNFSRTVLKRKDYYNNNSNNNSGKKEADAITGVDIRVNDTTINLESQTNVSFTKSNSNIQSTKTANIIISQNEIQIDEQSKLFLKENLKVSHFRYRGESPNAMQELVEISSSFIQPLSKLRYTYSKLDRNL